MYVYNIQFNIVSMHLTYALHINDIVKVPQIGRGFLFAVTCSCRASVCKILIDTASTSNYC